MFTFTFLFAFGLLAALQVSGAWVERIPATSAEQTEIVKKHNDLRRSVYPTASNMLKMSWNAEAAANAQKWANTCSMEHSPDSFRVISTSGCGENLYKASYKNSWSDAIQSWYDEVKDWRYGVGSINRKKVGHFTQVVWYNSNQVGCALAYCPNSEYKYFYVCQYCPPGNYQYAHPYKEGTSCGDCPNNCDNKLCTNACSYTDKYSNCLDLKRSWSCNHPSVADGCPASCKCGSDII